MSVFVNGCPRYTFRIGVAGKARLLHAQTASQVDSRFPPLCFPLLATNNKGTPKYRRFGSGASLFSEVLISAPPSDTPAKLTEANPRPRDCERQFAPVVRLPISLKLTPKDQRPGKEDQLVVSSAVYCPRSLKGVSSNWRPVKYPMFCIQSRVS